jgi:hypothetical protein
MVCQFQRKTGIIIMEDKLGRPIITLNEEIKRLVEARKILSEMIMEFIRIYGEVQNEWYDKLLLSSGKIDSIINNLIILEYDNKQDI